MGVVLQIREQVDRAAKGAELQQATFATGDNFWTLVDAAGDQTYENRVKGSDITALDVALAASTQLGSAFRVWWDRHTTYFTTDLGLSATGAIDTYLSTIAGFRMPYAMAECLVNAMGEGARLDPQNVFAKGTYATSGSLAAVGLHVFGALTGTAGNPTYAAGADGALDITTVMSPMLVQSREATPGDTSLVMTFTRQDATTVDLSVVPSASANGQVVIGQEVITGVTGAVFTCAATGQFKVGEWVLLYENADGTTSLREAAQIKTIVANTSIEFEDTPVNTFTSSGLILPMFADLTWKSGTITDGKHLDFYAKPDRIIAL